MRHSPDPSSETPLDMPPTPAALKHTQTDTHTYTPYNTHPDCFLRPKINAAYISLCPKTAQSREAAITHCIYNIPRRVRLRQRLLYLSRQVSVVSPS